MNRDPLFNDFLFVLFTAYLMMNSSDIFTNQLFSDFNPLATVIFLTFSASASEQLA